MPATNGTIAYARTDADDRLIAADEPLAGLQLRCGGDLPGTIAVPELLELVRKSRRLGLRLARTIEAVDGDETVRAWAELAPSDAGCDIAIGAWQSVARSPEGDAAVAARRIAIDRELAELAARLDPAQRVLAVESRARDLVELARSMREGRGERWTAFVEFADLPHSQPVHWRLLDGARLAVPGSQRRWSATLIPLGQPEPGSAGFELLLVADTPLSDPPPTADAPVRLPPAFGRELTPVLRQPIARIIANAETIRSRLAGPLADEYSSYAADIANAGQHLLALVEDLSDLEVVESEDFATAPDRIDLADVARRAVGILGVRAREREITVVLPHEGETMPATAEFRRVLQILINLIGNAINYSPRGSTVTIAVGTVAGQPRIAVADQGGGIPADKLEAVFAKFERLGRSDDGGSGLGLYISRRLARAMGGDLVAFSAPGEGARFELTLPPG